MSDVRGRHVANLQRETEAGAPPPSLSTSLGARAPGAPAGGIFTSRSPLKRASYRGRPLVKYHIKPPVVSEEARGSSNPIEAGKSETRRNL